jgi:16S rRNA U1498 N3-methylase RsmE
MARRQAEKRRFFVVDLRGERVALTGTEGHHVVNVLRLVVGPEGGLTDAICRSDSPD